MNCPNCNAEIPDEATVCPSCSHELTPVVGETPTEEPKASRPGWLVFAGVGAVVLAIGAAAFAFSGRGAAQGFAERIPADAFAYVEIDIEALMSDEVKEVVAAFGPVVEAESGEEFDVDAWLDEIIDSFDEELAGFDMTYEQDVASWATGPVAIGMIGGAEEPDVVAVVGGSDPAALDSFLSKLEAQADGTQEIAGVRFLTTTQDGKQVHVGRVDNDLVATSSATLAETMVTGPEESLADHEAFNAQVGALQEDGIFVFAVDTEKATEISDAAAPMNPMMTMTGQDLGAYTTGWVAGSLGVEGGNIRVDYAATVTDDFPLRGADPAVEEALPAETIAFFRIGSMIDQLALLGESGILDGMEEAYGLTLDDLVALFTVDGAVGVWPSTDPEIPVNAAVVALSDSNRAATVDKIADLGTTLGWNVAEADWGYTIEGLVGLGTRDALTILATQTNLIGAPPESSFASSDLNRRAQSLVGGDLVLAVDTPALIDLVDGLIGMEDPEAAETLACLPIGVVAAGTEISGRDVRGSTVIEITEPC